MSLTCLQVALQNVFAFGDQIEVDGLLTSVRQIGVARAVVDRRNAELGESRHVGPAELRGGRLAHNRHELRGRGRGQARLRGRCHIGDTYVEATEHVANVRLCVVDRSIRGEPEVDTDDALVRDHVAGDTATDADGGQAFAVQAAVDV